MLIGNIFIFDGWIYGLFDSENGCIIMFDGVFVDFVKNDVLYILFGFIDLYVYGGGGVDVMEGGDVIEMIVCMYV